MFFLSMLLFVILKRNRIFFPARLIFTLVIFLIIGKNLYTQDASSIVRAGLRSSVYGFNSFPDTTWWLNASSDMASRFPAASPSVIWILGYTTDNGCYLNFPNPYPDSSFNKVFFSSKDGNEVYLNYFDEKGVKVWLQVEPGFADVSTLIDLALTQYGHHPCVIGFGVDVEWFKTSASNNDEGEAVTDAEAEAWGSRIKSYNKDYLLFTKHWLIEKMPPTFRTDMVFVDDSQIFQKMDDMVSEFADWAEAFAPAKVAFQYGYDSDKPWWSNLPDPPKNIGDEILKRCSNVSDLYWVDFTAYDIWPKDFTPTSVSDKNANTLFYGYALKQNYPNPFNPSTSIEFSIPKSERVVLKVYDLLGREITTLLNEEKIGGTYKIKFNAESLSCGIYYYKITAGMFTDSKKFIFLK
jgi:Secretion system C-terminal sorting domain